MFGRRHVKSRRDLVRAELGESLELLRQAAAHAAGGIGAGVGPSLNSAREANWKSLRSAREANWNMNWGSARERAMSARDRATSARGMVRPAADRMSGVVSSAASQRWDATIAAFAPLAEAARAGSVKAAKLDAKRAGKRFGGKKNGSRKTRFTVTAKAEEQSNGHTALYALLATGAAVGAAGALVARRRTRAKWAEYEPSSLSDDASSFRGAGATSKHPSSSGMTDPSGRKGGAKDRARSAVGQIKGRIHDATGDGGAPGGAPGKAAGGAPGGGPGGVPGGPNDGRENYGDTPEAKMNVRSDSTSHPTDRIDDEVDDLIRSAKNGRM